MSVTHPLLGRRPDRTGPSVTLLPQHEEMRLAQARLHEACGAARRTFAMWLAARIPGQVMWISPVWNKDRLNPDGMAQWVDPARFIFVDAIRAQDVLWSLEEALRSGAIPLVIGDLPAPPGLTQVRRMHLAAETGGTNGSYIPLGLLLTPGMGGAQGVETRWQLNPTHHVSPNSWALKRLRARTAPQTSWSLSLHGNPRSPSIKAA